MFYRLTITDAMFKHLSQKLPFRKMMTENEVDNLVLGIIIFTGYVSDAYLQKVPYKLVYMKSASYAYCGMNNCNQEILLDVNRYLKKLFLVYSAETDMLV